MKRVLEAYFFRHGEVEPSSRPDLISGPNISQELTPKGIKQSFLLGQRLNERGIIPDRIYSSTAVRNQQTANFVLESMGISLPIHTNEGLQGPDLGDWVGQSIEEIYTDEMLSEMKALDKSYKPPGGESNMEVGERVMKVLNSLVFASPAYEKTERIFLFSHGMAIRCLVAKLNEWSQKDIDQVRVSNTSCSLIVLQNQGWQVDYIGKDLASRD